MKKLFIPILFFVACKNATPSKDAILIKEEQEIYQRRDKAIHQRDSIHKLYDSLYVK